MGSQNHQSLMDRWRTWRGALRDSLSGEEHDCTEGNLPRAIVLLAIPMVLETTMEALFAVAPFWRCLSISAIQ